MSNQLWPEGFYDTDGLVSGEFTEINQKDCCKLTFAMSNQNTTKTVLLFFNAGENERISMEQLAKFGWNGSADNPQFSNPQAATQLKCEHYQKAPGKVIESWKVAGTSAPLPKDRAKVLEAKFRSVAPRPAPSGRPAAPPPASRPTQQAPAAPSAPPASSPPPSAPVQAPPAAKVQHTKETAWKAWENAAKELDPTGNGQPDVQMWCQTRDKLMGEFGKHETEWGSEEWGKMAEVAGIPF